ncbi:MAG TPA: hypothetical protein DHL02_09790 [Achromobacter sp.]|nr:hypothetical protein [Achromobacter sp.]
MDLLESVMFIRMMGRQLKNRVQTHIQNAPAKAQRTVLQRIRINALLWHIGREAVQRLMSYIR